MWPPRPPRDPERGNSLVLALIVMSALATLGSLTVVSMQSSIQTSTNDRAQTIALYAAESGAAVTMAALRTVFDPATTKGFTTWSGYLTSGNQPLFPPVTPLVPSSGAKPGDPNNLFDRDQNAWYEIQLLNNRDDPNFGAANTTNDRDGILIIRSTGHGPQGSLAIVEWEVQRVGLWAASKNAVLAPQDPPLPPPGTPPPYPGFLLYPPATVPPNSLPYPPSFGWDGWVPSSLNIYGVGPPSLYNVGMVLLGWHIVSL